MLATEMYKTKNSLSPPIIREIFQVNGISYSLRNTNYFKLTRPNTVHNGLESVKYLGYILLLDDLFFFVTYYIFIELFCF